MEDALENPIQLGAEGVRYGIVLNLSGKRTELQIIIRLRRILCVCLEPLILRLFLFQRIHGSEMIPHRYFPGR